MRKILFRGKRIDNGEWVEGYITRRPSAIQFGAHYSPWFIDKPPSDPDDSGDFCNVDGKTVGQFTGLTDRKGKRIFEGDIVKWDGTEISIIRYCDGVYRLCNAKGYYGVSVHNHYSFVEVVGNVHDNPDLLANEKEET